jgi:hypothetical protein
MYLNVQVEREVRWCLKAACQNERQDATDAALQFPAMTSH